MIDGSWVLYANMGYFWNINVYGYDVVLFAFIEAALGRVPKQVLQGRWVQVCAALL